jgi:hypothetical protein
MECEGSLPIQQPHLSESWARWKSPTSQPMWYEGKGKVFPLQAWPGPWGSGRLRLRILSTFGTMTEVRSSPLSTGRLYPQEFSWYSFLETESTPGHMVPSVGSEKNLQQHDWGSIPRPFDYYATPGPTQRNIHFNIIRRFSSPIRATCAAHIITLVISGENCKSLTAYWPNRTSIIVNVLRLR